MDAIDRHRGSYAERFARVLEYIGEHLDEDLSVDVLSSVAGFSPFHFHRQFREYTGVPVAKIVAALRLKEAAMKLVFSPQSRIVEIALDAGWDSHEGFARAFKKALGFSPSQFRASPQWQRWSEAFATTPNTRIEKMDVRIVNFEETRVAVLEHCGPKEKLMESVQRFIAWRKGTEVSPEKSSMTIGIAYADPDACDPQEWRFDICGSIKGEVPENDYGIVDKTIPGGRCAVARHLGSTDAIAETVHELYGQWLPESGEELREFPLFFHYIDRMPRVAEHQQVTDVYLPLK